MVFMGKKSFHARLPILLLLPPPPPQLDFALAAEPVEGGGEVGTLTQLWWNARDPDITPLSVTGYSVLSNFLSL
jgi:hypothetical protein